MTYASGQRYDKEWSSNKKSGKGKMTCAKGKMYDGEWQNDKRSGYG